MSDLRIAAQQALEALEEYQSKGAPFLACDGAVAALKAALTQQADKPQRPKCLEFALDFLGTPENGELRAYIEQLEARAALAQQDELVQEPVAWYQKRRQEVWTSHPACWGREDEPWTPLYTAPPPPQRKPLTEEDVDRICASLGFAAISPAEIVRAVERAHGIGETK